MAMIEREIDGAIATDTMNRPDKRNAMSDAFIAELENAFVTIAYQVAAYQIFKISLTGFILNFPHHFFKLQMRKRVITVQPRTQGLNIVNNPFRKTTEVCFTQAEVHRIDSRPHHIFFYSVFNQII